MTSGASRARLLAALDRFFDEVVPVGTGEKLLVAFSAGADSTALLWGLAQLRASRGLRLEAGHVDHRLDPGSPSRAERARRSSAALGVPLTVVERQVAPSLVGARGVEAAARTVRYRALEEIRRLRGAGYTVTGHHRDDQIETVLLRLEAGSGWQGLGGIPARSAAVVRPLLMLSRAELRAALAGTGLEPAEDPTNFDLGPRRNRLRQRLLPYLEGLEPGFGRRCLRVAAAAAAARLRVDGRLERLLEPRPTADGASLSLEALERLPPALLPAAAALLHRTAGADYPPSLAAVTELGRQLRTEHRLGGDFGDGWRWQERGDRLHLLRRRSKPADFTYTLEVPGEVDLAEISLRLRVGRSPVAAWMFQGSATRAGLGGTLQPGERVTVRNRRPGDRLRPLGCSYTRRLKEVLIDRRIPRAERDRIPLLCVGGRIAWVPGVTIDDRFRLGDEDRAWVAELEAT